MSRKAFRDAREAIGLPRRTDAEKKSRAVWLQQRERKRAAQMVQLMRDYKSARGCADCGYNENPVALDLDHLPGYDKVERVAQIAGKGRSMAALLAELPKCEVVCANCHRIRTEARKLSTKEH